MIKLKGLKAAVCGLVAAAACAAVIPLAGCSAKQEYALNVDENGDKYYVASCGGFPSALGGTLEIPAYFGEGEDYAPVKEIAQSGFSACSITKLIIPETVETIGAAAFSHCYSLREVEFAEGCAIGVMPRGIFAYCRMLSEIKIPQTVTAIAGLAFSECAELKAAYLPDGLEVIGDQAFSNCVSLSAITFPEGLITIGYEAFYTTGLEEVTIPASVRDTQVTLESGELDTLPGIGPAAFHTCTSLKKAVVKANVGAIKSGTFGYCTALEEIYLPKSVKIIEHGFYMSDGGVYYGHAFHNDAALKTIYYEGTEEEFAKIEVQNVAVSDNGVKYDNSYFVAAGKVYNSVF